MDAEQLVGSWRLVSASSTTPKGERSESPYGANPSGSLLYTTDHRVAALISYSGRKILKPVSSAEEQAEAFKTFIGYAGRYTLNGDQIIHHVEVSSVQNYVNKDLVRSVKFQSNLLILVTPPTLVNGEIQVVELIWERLPIDS